MLRVYNETTKKFVPKNSKNIIFGLVYYDEEKNIIEFGYFSNDVPTIVIETPKGVFKCIRDNIKGNLHFNRNTGFYCNYIPQHNYRFVKRPNNFPCVYSTRTLENTYEKTVESFDTIQFKYMDEMPYTFGLEFETAGGLIPEDSVYKLGLIPLRDGSIRGIEFSTIILKGNEGFNLLKQQLNTLQEYTVFDKQCALHIHFGGFRLDPQVLLRVNNLMHDLNLQMYLPLYTFCTSKYKENGKEYNVINNYFNSFQELYLYNVGYPYFGDLYQPHPNDLSGNQKWRIPQRYTSCNLINALCYDYNKTIEFRFLRPSYNFDKIICWIYILSAIIKYAEGDNIITSDITIEDVICSVYNDNNGLLNILSRFLCLQYYVVQLQTQLYDYIGLRNDIEDRIIKKDNININNFFY